MTNDKRLEHQTPSQRRGGGLPPAHDYRAAEIRAEELQAVAPVFRRLLKRKLTMPSPDQWRGFSQELNRKLEIQDAPYTQTLRDRIAASDSALMRWFWIILALLVLLAVGAVIAVSLANQPVPTAVALMTDTYQYGEAAAECLKCII